MSKNVLKFHNVILTVDFRLHDEKKEILKCDVNVRIKIKKSRLLHAWLHGVDLAMCKQTKRQIIFTIQSNYASKQAT